MTIRSGWQIDRLRGGIGQRQLLDIDELHIPAGAVTLLVGRNGAGKTTLLETLAGLHKPQEGTIHIDGLPLWQEGRLQREALLAFSITLQHSHAQWFAPTVRDELTYSLLPLRLEADESERRIAAALSRCALSPELLGSDPWRLSGGEQRRLALCCAIAPHPRWLLLDEPTAGLDGAGLRELRELLREHRSQGGGALIVTHDWDALWPLADYVIELADGRVQSCRTRRETAACWQQAASDSDVAAPQMTEEAAVLLALRRRGVAIPGLAEGERIAPGQLAERISVQLGKPRTVADAPPARSSDRAATIAATPTDAPPASAAATDAPAAPDTARGSRLRERDPRMLWAAYMLLSFGLLLQQAWPGLLVGAAVTGAILWQVRDELVAWRGVIRMYALFAIIVTALSAVQLRPLGWDLTAGAATTLQFAKIFLVMLLGIALAQLVTPFRMQRALEQGLSGLARLGASVRTIALTVALIFRFLPLLTVEWERFARITRARGKSTAPPGRIVFRQLPRMLVPYLVSMLRLAEQMAEALEVRGFGRETRPPTRLYRLELQLADYVLAAAGLILFIALATARSIPS